VLDHGAAVTTDGQLVDGDPQRGGAAPTAQPEPREHYYDVKRTQHGSEGA
jgi:hypothetical protein